MTFPQTSPEVAIRQGKEYWRLFTTLESSGDIFETPVSGRAFVIGPQSDISRAKLIYFDQQAPNLADEVIVSVDKPFIGRLDALGSQTYTSGDQARILISSADYGPPPVGTNPFRPPSALAPTGGGDQTVIEIVPPRIDLFQYLNEPPAIVPVRVDRVHQFDQVINNTGDQQWYLVPFFGRRYGEVGVKTRGITASPVPEIDVYVYGINLSYILADSGLGDGDSGHQQEMLGSFHLNVPSPPVLEPTGGGQAGFITIQSRSFDYLAVQIQSATDYPLETVVNTRIVVSDKV